MKQEQIEDIKCELDTEQIKFELNKLRVTSRYFDCVSAIAFLSGRIPKMPIGCIYRIFGDILFDINETRLNHLMNDTMDYMNNGKVLKKW